MTDVTMHRMLLRSAVVLIILAGVLSMPGHAAPPTPSQVSAQPLLAAHAAALRYHYPMVIDFYSRTCDVCKRLAPKVSQAERQWKGRVVFLRALWEDPSIQPLAAKYGVSGFPTLIFVNSSGEYSDLLMGDVPLQDIVDRIKPLF